MYNYILIRLFRLFSSLKFFVEIHMTTTENQLPFSVVFKHFDQLGGLLEEREYAQAGTKDLARKFALDVATRRLNSFEFVLDGE